VLALVVRNSLLMVGVTVAVVVLLRDYTTVLHPTGGGNAAPTTVAARSPATAPLPERAAQANQMVIQAGPHGHFFVEAQIRSRNIRFLVDTGASFVTLSQDDAERLGYAIHQLDYSGISNTANGMARFAPVVIDEIAIGDFVVRDVQASVIDSPMEGSLLGMAFLRKLPGFEVRHDRLILKW